MAYSSGSINSVLDFNALFDTFLLANGWTKTAKSVAITVSNITYVAANVSSLSFASGALNTVPAGAKADWTGLTTQKVYIGNKSTLTSCNLISDQVFTSIGAISVTFTWDLYTKGTKNFTFVGAKHFIATETIEYILGDISHNNLDFPVMVTGLSPRGGLCKFLQSASQLPASYEIFYNPTPDTVSVVFNSASQVQHLHIGDLNKVNAVAYTGGEFLSGSSSVTINNTVGSNISETALILSNSSAGTNGGFFTAAGSFSGGTLHCEIDGKIYSSSSSPGSIGTANLTQNCARKFNRGLNNWNQQALLVPIELQFNALASFKMYLGYIEHVRFVRTDNYNIGDIITIGSEQWKVFPMMKKNAAIRSGNLSGPGLSGTLGFAVRYTP